MKIRIDQLRQTSIRQIDNILSGIHAGRKIKLSPKGIEIGY